MNISGEVVRTSQLPKKTLGLNDSLVALMSSPLETVTVPVSDFVSFVATQLLTASADSLDSVTTVGNTTANTITIGGATSPYYQLNTLSPGTQAVGRFVWNDVDGTADLRLKGGNVTLQLGQETVVRVVNKTNANLLESEYKVVRVRIASEGGAQGQRLAVVLAQGNNDPDSVTTLGIVTENINNNQEGFITVFGNVSGINTTGSLQGETWADGDVLFLSPTTPGALTKVKPVAPNHTVVMGYVVYAHQNNGKIFVKVDNGYELEELHDVLPTPYVNNGVLYRDTTANLWRSATISTLLGYTPSNASGTTNYLSKFTGTTTLGNSLIYDNGTNVGIGTTSPTDRLHIVDASNANIFARVTANGTNASAAWVAQNDQVDNVVYRVFGSAATGTQMGISLARSASLLANLGGTGSFVVGTFSNTDFILGTANTERARINTSGNFLIGTTIDAGYKLDVNGSTRVVGGTTSADTPFIINNRFRFKGDGVLQYGSAAGHGRLTWDNSGVYFGGLSGYGVGLGANTTTNHLFINTSGNVGIGTTTINSSALFQVESTTKGILGPRLTTAQILAISTPAEGLYVYNTDLKTLCFYNGTAWQKVTSTAM